MSQPKIAIVYDWATTQYGGAEKVLDALHLAFPEATLCTSVANYQKATWTKNWKVVTSFLQKIPAAPQHHQALALALPLAFEALDVSSFDIILSVTSSSAKGVLTLPHQLHLCYLLTPPRYVYTHQDAYLPNPFVRWLAQPFLKYLRWWDEVAAYRPDYLLTLSKLVAQRITQSYGRAVEEIVYPPIAIAPLASPTPPDTVKPNRFFLVASRLVTYKRIDLAILACLKAEYELVIIGDGPQRSMLENVAAGSELIHFLGNQPSESTSWYLSHCQALIMPGIEDFGMTAAEAVAHGRPAIVHQNSGVAEILSQENAVFIKELTPSAIISACQRVMSNKYNQEQLRQSMGKYVTTTFVKTIKSVVLKHWSNHNPERTV